MNRPAFVIDCKKLKANAQLAAAVHKASGLNILLALKAFALPAVFEYIRPYLQGVAASSLSETALGAIFGKEVHVYSPAFKTVEMAAICERATHINFNSFSQFVAMKTAMDLEKISLGIRVNPEYSEIKTQLYNPCAKQSRFGVLKEFFDEALFQQYFEGIHVHALCGSNQHQLQRLVDALESRFSEELKRAKWLNLGGGQLLCKPNFDRNALSDMVRYLANAYDLEIFMEPGEGLVADSAILEATVIDIIFNDGPVAILDVSATNHMPDVLEMPYRPNVVGAGNPGEKAYCYRLGGPTCLSGDVIGDYSFDEPLEIGQQLVFNDMAQYTFVKTTFFNGVDHPDIIIQDLEGKRHLIKRFGVEDFFDKLGVKKNDLVDFRKQDKLILKKK